LEPERIRTLDRGLQIVHYLAEERRSVGVSQIAQATGLPAGTVHRLLAALMARDWVEQNPQTSKYHLGFGLLGVAAAATAYTPLVDRARPVLKRLSEISGLHSYLGVLVGSHTAYLAMAEGRDADVHEFDRGLLQPAHATSAGKVLLAYLPQEEFDRLYPANRPLVAYTSKTLADVEALRQELARIRKEGLAWDRGEMKESWHGVAIRIRGSDGRVIASMKTGGATAVATPEHLKRVAEEMRVLSVELSVQLGMGD
jgi:DNA-binding IclR family transcriptional regulator